MKQPVPPEPRQPHTPALSNARFNLRTEAIDTYCPLSHHLYTEECYMEHRNRDGLTVEQWKYWR